MKKETNIPILDPVVFREEFITNNQNALVGSPKINEFFIHSFKEDLVSLKLPLPPHKKTVNDFVFILQGAMTKTIGLESFTLTADDFLFTPKNSITTSQDITPDLEGFYCHFSDDFLAENPFLKPWHTQATTHNLVKTSKEERENLRFLLDKILTLYRQTRHNPTYYRLIPFYLSTFLAEVSIINENQIDKSQVHPLIPKFNQLLNEHFKISKNVGFYAELLHISPNHLNKIIKNGTGKTASDVINRICILEAKVLLMQTNLDIRQIALELGYEDYSYFSRFFKRHAGTSPTKYRQMIESS